MEKSSRLLVEKVNRVLIDTERGLVAQGTEAFGDSSLVYSR